MDKNCLIVEDNSIQREMMRKLVSEASSEVNIFDVGTMRDAFDVLLENTIDVFIVDIILNKDTKGDISGVKLVNVIRDIPQYMFTPVIFVTSLEDPELFAYSNLHCFSYLEKPFSHDDAKEMIRNALTYTTPRKEQDVLCIRKGGVLFPYKINEIIYIESLNRDITIYIEGGKVEKLPYMTCKKILQEANNSSLIQCSRGVIVNRNYIESIDKINRYLTIKGCNERLNIGGTYLQNLVEQVCDES